MKNMFLIFMFIVSVFNFSSCNFYTKEVGAFLNDVIFIDPGHGGKDNGTSYNDVLEDEINLKLALILYEDLINQGNTCYLSRTADYDLSSMYAKNHKIEDLNKRIKYIDSLNTTVFISLHLNYYNNSNVNGIQVFYQKNNENSYSLALILQKHLNLENSKDKKCFKGDYYLLNNSKTTGVIIEYGFLSNEYDRKKILNEKYLHHLSNIIKNGINEYLIAFNK